LIHGFTVPGQNDTDLLTAIEAIPGALLGMGLIYWIGLRQERAHPAY
jgi:membrane protein DedA with SNARE-associated domain